MAMMMAFRGLTEPIAEAQKVEAQENTKQMELIQAGETNRQKHRLAFAGLIVVLVTVVACVALASGHDSIAENIVIAAIAFAGGFGAGKGNASDQ